ncbi:MAG: T9SS type A sorting domain-containing protein [Ignavibacteria bacterium]|nr:T9SS type A sorting domain-containing protein [Ignavibacteria bacterium]
MKCIICLIVACLFFASLARQEADAQPLLDSRTLPAPAKAVLLFYCDTTGVRPGPGGVDMLWSFGELKVRQLMPRDGSIRYIAVQEFPPELRDSFPQAQVGIVDGTVTTAYMTQGTTFRMLGSSSSQANLTVSYMDPYDTRPTELTFNEPFVDSWRASIWPKSGGTNPKRIGNDTVVYDGIGTLVLPKQLPFTNVARLTRKSTTSDTVLQGPNVLVTTTQTTTSTWLPSTSNEILLEIAASRVTTRRNGIPVGQPVLTTSVRAQQWDTTAPNSVDDEYQHSSIFPNPVFDNVLFINDLPFEPLTVSLIDVSGQRISSPQATMVGLNSWRVSIPNTSSGVYSLVIEGDCPSRQCPPIVFLVMIMR